MTTSTNELPLFAFFGSPVQAVYVLDALFAQGLVPALIVTAPDRPAGRGMELVPCPAKQWAIEHDIDVLSPEKLSDPAFLEEISQFPWDVFIVAAYGKLIPRSVFSLPKHSTLNIHPSLLPKYRGASPVLSNILADESETGISIIEIVEAMDAGDVVAQARVQFPPEDWPPQGSVLEELLFTEGANLLAEALPAWFAGTLPREKQDEAAATFTRKFTKEDAQLNLVNGNPRENFLKTRAFDKNPRAWFITASDKRVVVTESAWEDDTLKILRVIPEGRTEMSYEDFLRGEH